MISATLRDYASDPRGLPAKRDNWRGMLAAWESRAHTTPFSWGHWDCCLAACTAVRMMTGFDPACELRGRYSNERQALRLIRLVCRGRDVLDISKWVVDRYGYSAITGPLSLGDVCVSEVDGRQTMGIYTGHGAVFPGINGVVVRSNVTPLMAWRP